MAYTTTIACGHKFVAVVLNDGSVHCWGDNKHGQCFVPRDLPPVKEIYCLSATCIALCEDNSLYSWGKKLHDEPCLGKAKKILGGDFCGVCVLREDDTLAIWGYYNNQKLLLFNDICPKDILQVSWATLETAVLLNDGSIRSWRHINNTKWDVTDNLPPAQQIMWDAYGLVVLFQDGTMQRFCDGYIKYKLNLVAVKQIGNYNAYAMALYDNGTVCRWEHDNDTNVFKQINVPLPLMPVAQITQYNSNSVVFLCEDGSVHFWDKRRKKTKHMDFLPPAKMPERRDECVYVLK
jgi:WD40 repeat protein